MNFGLKKLSKLTWYCNYCSKLKKKEKKEEEDKVAKQNGIVDVQCKNTGCRVIYIKGKKSKNRRLKKKKLL